MTYKLHREVKDGRLVHLSLGIPEIDAYLDFVRHRSRQNTWLSVAYDLQVFVNAVEKPVLAVRPADIFAFLQHQQEQPPWARRRRGLVPLGGLSPRTIQRRLSTVSGFYTYLVVRGDSPITVNPVPRGLPTRGTFWGSLGRHGHGGRVVPLVRAPDTLPRPMEREEVERFTASLRTFRDRAMVLIMLLGGLRKAEVLGLHLEDLDFGEGTVRVRDGKGGLERLVPVASSALQALLEYLQKERPSGPSTRVFVVLKGPRRGLPLTIPGLDMIITYHRRKAGTPGLQCHRLRHTCLTRLRQAGMSLESLQAQAGHRSIASTRIYLHLCPEELRDEYVRVMGELFGPRGDQEVARG